MTAHGQGHRHALLVSGAFEAGVHGGDSTTVTNSASALMYITSTVELSILPADVWSVVDRGFPAGRSNSLVAPSGRTLLISPTVRLLTELISPKMCCFLSIYILVVDYLHVSASVRPGR